MRRLKDGINEYRLGSVILHKEGSGKYNIVDGQQRLTTLPILLYCLGDDKQGMLKEKCGKLSYGDRWKEDYLNGFGNLALITISGNSKFSNLPPAGKINSYPSIINQSLKLKVMEIITRLGDGKWTEEKSSIHKDEMIKILKNKGQKLLEA